MGYRRKSRFSESIQWVSDHKFGERVGGLGLPDANTMESVILAVNVQGDGSDNDNLQSWCTFSLISRGLIYQGEAAACTQFKVWKGLKSWGFVYLFRFGF